MSEATDRPDEDVELSAVEKEKLKHEGTLNGHLIFSVGVIVLSSIQFGFNIGAVNAPGHFIKSWIDASHFDIFGTHLGSTVTIVFSAAVALFALGGLVGGLIVGWLADSQGRRTSLLINNILAIGAGILMTTSYYANFYPIFIIGRFIIGINAGIASGLVPLYLTELSPIRLRGAFGSLPQLVVTISILISQIVGLPQIFGTATLWPIIFALILIPAILQVIGLMFISESPKYTLAFRDDYAQALEDLTKLRGNSDNAKLELRAMRNEESELSEDQNASIFKMFSPAYRWPMILGMGLMIAQQLSGINAAMFYSTEIFKEAGLTGQGAVYATIAMGTINVLITMISVWLVDHPRFGRRLLLIIGKLGMAIMGIGLVISMALNRNKISDDVAPYFSTIFLPLYVVFFAIGPGSIPFFIVSELFASDVRGSANSIAVATNWGCNFLISLGFLPLNQIFHEFTFLIFVVVCILAALFVWRYLPETKHKSLKDVQTDMASRRSKFS
ncbi:MFS domain-containing protein [Aphelenchoides besseyi]|nr:MFS domain-containing protein [Aphelenchoides besseyi]KAI6221235.1 MFS domain-containing protein [Aphelenchoides besseyi]